jgi:hypothetical protein
VLLTEAGEAELISSHGLDAVHRLRDEHSSNTALAAAKQSLSGA